MPPFESPLPRKLGPGRPQAAPRLPKTTRRRPQDGPKMASRRPKTAPRHRQGGSKTASSRPRTSQDGPRRPKTSPRQPWTTFLADFLLVFGRFLDDVLDYFCNDFAPTCSNSYTGPRTAQDSPRLPKTPQDGSRHPNDPLNEYDTILERCLGCNTKSKYG